MQPELNANQSNAASSYDNKSPERDRKKPIRARSASLGLPVSTQYKDGLSAKTKSEAKKRLSFSGFSRKYKSLLPKKVKSDPKIVEGKGKNRASKIGKKVFTEPRRKATVLQGASSSPQIQQAFGESKDTLAQANEMARGIRDDLEYLEKGIALLESYAHRVENTSSEDLSQLRMHQKFEDRVKNKLQALQKKIDQLPLERKLIVFKLLGKQVMRSGNSFIYSKIEDFMAEMDSPEASVVKGLIRDLKIMNVSSVDSTVKTNITIGDSDVSEGAVTVLCPLMVDGMGDLGIAMNAFDSLRDSLPHVDLKLVVLVVSNNPLGPGQIEKVKQMTKGKSGIEIIAGEFNPRTGAVGSLKKFSVDQQDKMKALLGKTDVLLNLPIDHKEGLQELKDMMPKESKIIVSSEYGLRISDQSKSQKSENIEDRRIETGPAIAVYLNEGKLSVDLIYDILRNDSDVNDILPFSQLGKDVSSQDAIAGYSEENNLVLFYLNKETPKRSTQLYFEQYLDVHSDDERNLNVIGTLPEEILLDKNFQKKLAKKYGIIILEIKNKNGENQEIRLEKLKKGQKSRKLTIYRNYGFKRESFRAISEMTLYSSGGYPNMMFAAGDGSFSDALSLMVNYSQNPHEEGFAVSLPIFIPRLSFHRRSVEELLELCDHINEPQVKEVFERFQNIETLTSEERKELTQAMRSDGLKVGLGRLAQHFAESHNLSRELSEHTKSELKSVLQVRAARKAVSISPISDQ